MSRRCLNIALRHIGHHRRDQGVAELARDEIRRVIDDELVLAEHHVRPVLLGAGGRDDDYATFMLGVCLLACVVPTRRALGVEPASALRTD